MTSGTRRADCPLRIGSAPDSWGVWFPHDANQPSWRRFLDEVAEAGYRWIELGPYGYLPTDPPRLADELAGRGLQLSAGTCFAALHHADSWQRTWAHVRKVASLTAALGARHLVVIPEMWRDQATGRELEDRQLSRPAWAALATGLNRLATALWRDFGLRLQFHPHADSHIDTQPRVERLLEMTDPEVVTLCLDTGHIAYCGGDNAELIREYPDRIGYLHLKQVDPAVLDDVRREDLAFGPAVRRGVMCEPPGGVPDLESIVAMVHDLNVDLFAIVEQDLYPCAPDTPMPIAKRTRRYLTRCGLGTVR